MPDPAGQDFSSCAHAGNRPLVYVDPNGTIAWFVPILMGEAIGGIIPDYFQSLWTSLLLPTHFIGKLMNSILSTKNLVKHHDALNRKSANRKIKQSRVIRC